MKKTVILLLGFVAVFLNACLKDSISSESANAAAQDEKTITDYLAKNPTQTFTTTNSGLRYRKLIEKPSGKSLAVGNEVTLQYLLTKLDGTFVDSTTSAKPLVFPVGASLMISGLEEGLSYLKEGEKAELIIPSTLAFGNDATVVPAWTVVRMIVTAVKYRTEDEQINDYVASKGLTIKETTSSGLRFVQTSSFPDSVAIASGKTVHVKYTGYTLNDTQFDTGEFNLVTGSNSVIKGFEEGILKMRKNEKATLVFPSSIGYSKAGAINNSTGYYKILPYAPLRFDVEITSVN